MILNKKHFEEFGFKNVIDTIPTPVTLMNGVAVVAKTFHYDSVEALKNEAWFKDALNCCDSPLCLFPLPESADKMNGIVFRMFTTPTSP